MSTLRGARFDNNGLLIPSGSLYDGDIATPSAGSLAIGGAKLKHQYPMFCNIAPATTVTAQTLFLGFVRQGATVVDFVAEITGTIATGADRTVNVDLQKATAAGSYSSILSATLLFNNSSVLRTIASTTISSPTLVAGDALVAVITVAGSAGNQAIGLWVGAWLIENPTA